MVCVPLNPDMLEPVIVTVELVVKFKGQAIPNPATPVKVAVVPVPVMLPIGMDAPVPAVIEEGADGFAVNEVAPA
jgi:hypothetical protein